MPTDRQIIDVFFTKTLGEDIFELIRDFIAGEKLDVYAHLEYDEVEEYYDFTYPDWRYEYYEEIWLWQNTNTPKPPINYYDMFELKISNISIFRRIAHHVKYDDLDDIMYFDDSGELVPLPVKYKRLPIIMNPWKLICSFDERGFSNDEEVEWDYNCKVSYTISFKGGETIYEIIQTIRKYPCHGYIEDIETIAKRDPYVVHAYDEKNNRMRSTDYCDAMWKGSVTPSFKIFYGT